MGKISTLFIVVFLMTIYAKSQSFDHTRAPNSYIFDIDVAKQNNKGGLLIPVKKAYALWASNQYLTDNGSNTPVPSGTQTASLYWEDVVGLVRSVELVGSGETAKIKVMIDPAKGKGNALVAFKVDGEVYWSWHIWVTEDPSNGVVYSQGFETDIDLVRFDPKYMDRNLGALSNNFLGNDWHKSAGLMYQWGRKDPFPTLVYKDATFFELNGEHIGTIRHKDATPTTVSTSFADDFLRPFDEIEKNIRFSVKNPITYISNTDDDPYTEPSGTNGTWFSKQQYRNGTTAWDLWADNYRGGMSNASSSNQTLANDSKSYELKSPYDPCPNGWRIPSYYGRVTTNNNHSPWGRKNSGGNDGANPAATFLYPDTQNTVLNGIKVYQGLGMDFENIPNRNLGVMPLTGNFEYYPNSVSSSSIPHSEYQDESGDGALWSATYSQGGARIYKMTADFDRDVNDTGSHSVVTNLTTTRPKEGNAVRCMEDPNLSKIGNFETEYVDSDIINYTDGLDNPNSYIVSGLSEIRIPVNKAFSVNNQYLTDHEMLPGNALKANVYWTTNTDLVTQVYIESNLSDFKNSEIVVKLNPSATGNAVISLHNENISNPVYWSWHIWAPQNEINQVTYTTEEIIPAQYNFVNLTNSRKPPLTTTFMDRNLGAVEALPDSGAPDMITKAENSGGFHYQWGRKDPIPSFLNPGNNAYTIFKGINVSSEGEITYQEINSTIYNSNYSSVYSNYESLAGVSSGDSRSIKINKIMKFAAENPLTYLFHDESGIQDWLSDETGYGQDRWGHASSKSPFDPCPAGWRVPDVSFVYSMFRGSSPWFNGKKLSSQQGNPHFLSSNYGGVPVMDGDTTLGWTFPDPLFRVGNYPATGIRVNGSTIEGNTYQMGVWTSALTLRQEGNGLAMKVKRETNGDHRVTSGGSFSPQNGMNVRCALDEPRYTGEQLCPSTTWNGSNWDNGDPDFNKKAIINGNLVLSADLEACELEVNENGSLEVPSDITLIINGKITNHATAEDFVIASGGSLIQIENVKNSGEITVLRNSQPFKRLDYTIWSSPVINQQLQAFSPHTLPNRIYTYEGISGYVSIPDETADFVTAKGYMFRAPNNWGATPAIYPGKFTGIPFNGNASIAAHAGSYTSIGNPYPSNIHADDLMTANPGISTFYFWTNVHPTDGGTYTGNNYATYTLLGGTSPDGSTITPDGIISTGQGFIIETTDNSVVFDNSLRISDPGTFYKNEGNEKHKFWLNLYNETKECKAQIMIGYMPGATYGFDFHIDGKMLEYEGSTLYNIVNDEKFTIQGRKWPFEASDVIPLGFKAETDGKYTISLVNFDGFFTKGKAKIYLKDKQENLVHNLIHSDYDFKSAAGEFKERFEITYNSEEGDDGPGDLLSNLVHIYTKQGDIFVESKSEKILSVEIYNLQGRIMHKNELINANNYFVKKLSDRILFVNVKLQNGETVSRKIIIE